MMRSSSWVNDGNWGEGEFWQILCVLNRVWMILVREQWWEYCEKCKKKSNLAGTYLVWLMQVHVMMWCGNCWYIQMLRPISLSWCSLFNVRNKVCTKVHIIEAKDKTLHWHYSKQSVIQPCWTVVEYQNGTIVSRMTINERIEIKNDNEVRWVSRTHINLVQCCMTLAIHGRCNIRSCATRLWIRYCLAFRLLSDSATGVRCLVVVLCRLIQCIITCRTVSTIVWRLWELTTGSSVWGSNLLLQFRSNISSFDIHDKIIIMLLPYKWVY